MCCTCPEARTASEHDHRSLKQEGHRASQSANDHRALLKNLPTDGHTIFSECPRPPWPAKAQTAGEWTSKSPRHVMEAHTCSAGSTTLVAQTARRRGPAGDGTRMIPTPQSRRSLTLRSRKPCCWRRAGRTARRATADYVRD